jgi:hypothetical protein
MDGHVPTRYCTVTGCTKVVAAKGLCPTHYAQQRRELTDQSVKTGRGLPKR